MTIASGYFSDSYVLKRFFKTVSRNRLCQMLEELELWASDPLTALRLASAVTAARE
jgi:hypothetical protein